MIGIVVLLAVSWALLRFITSENLTALVPFPLKKRLWEFCEGFFIAYLLNAILIVAEAGVRSADWLPSQDISILNVSTAIYYHLTSALTEDLVFRGALLYILMAKTKPLIGILLSGIAFGIYHWFSYGILSEGSIVLMYVLVTTGLMGAVWAYAFHKSESLALGWGMHSGWNIAVSCFLVAQPYGELVLTASGGSGLSDGTESVISILKGIIPPFAFYLYIQNRYAKNEGAC